MLDIGSGLALKAGAGWLFSQAKKHVIDHWTRRRAEAFFETFVERVADTDGEKRPLSSLEPVLEEMLDNEVKSNVLFDAYRQVCLSSTLALYAA